RLGEAVSAEPDRRGRDDAVQRDHRDLGRSAADIEHHRAARLVDRHAGPHRRRHRLFDEIDLPRTGTFGGFADRPTLDLRRAVRDTYKYTRARSEVARTVRLLDKVLEHLLGDVEVGDDAVLQRPDRGDVPRRAPEHILRFGADGLEHLTASPRLFTNRDDGRLVQYDPAASD